MVFHVQNHKLVAAVQIAFAYVGTVVGQALHLTGSWAFSPFMGIIPYGQF